MQKEVHHRQSLEGDNMKRREVVIVDSENGYGGGSIYLKRYRRWLENKGVACSYRRIRRGASGLWLAICLVVRCWIRDDI